MITLEFDGGEEKCSDHCLTISAKFSYICNQDSDPNQKKKWLETRKRDEYILVAEQRIATSGSARVTTLFKREEDDIISIVALQFTCLIEYSNVALIA